MFSTRFNVPSRAVHDKGGMALLDSDGGCVERVERIGVWPNGPDVVFNTSTTRRDTSVRVAHKEDDVDGGLVGV